MRLEAEEKCRGLGESWIQRATAKVNKKRACVYQKQMVTKGEDNSNTAQNWRRLQENEARHFQKPKIEVGCMYVWMDLCEVLRRWSWAAGQGCELGCLCRLHKTRKGRKARKASKVYYL